MEVLYPMNSYNLCSYMIMYIMQFLPIHILKFLLKSIVTFLLKVKLTLKNLNENLQIRKEHEI